MTFLSELLGSELLKYGAIFLGPLVAFISVYFYGRSSANKDRSARDLKDLVEREDSMKRVQARVISLEEKRSEQLDKIHSAPDSAALTELFRSTSWGETPREPTDKKTP